jgi:hypothetical protein
VNIARKKEAKKKGRKMVTPMLGQISVSASETSAVSLAAPQKSTPHHWPGANMGCDISESLH